MTRLIFLDTESTGLDPDRHEVWEVGYIVRDEDHRDVEAVWQIAPAHLERADPYALRIGRFWERRAKSEPPGIESFAAQGRAERFAALIDGATIVGAVPDFDVRFLTKWLARCGLPWTAHYHLCDVENLAVGYLRRQLDEESSLRGTGQAVSPWQALRAVLDPPWSSEALSMALGVKIREEDRHTALGDARWARDLYDVVMGFA